jgi:hypothetical protein
LEAVDDLPRRIRERMRKQGHKLNRYGNLGNGTGKKYYDADQEI